MVRIHSIFRCIVQRYFAYLFILCIICSCIFFIYSNRPSNSHVQVVITHHVNDFELYDDDGMPFICPSDIKFDIRNRQHLAIILAPKLLSFVWINFRALLCAGVDAYIMLDGPFQINSSLRVDDFKPRTSRNKNSYSHRFLYVKNQYLEKFGVTYMKKLPSIEYTTWDRAVVWLYHRTNFTYVWLVEHDVQWLDIRNMTYLFDYFANDTTDLLCDNIVQTNTYWGHWPRVTSDIFPKAYWLGTFSPLVRWSRLLLQHHYRYMQLMHKDRLKYEISLDYRFQEFIMATIVKTENLGIKVYSENTSYIHIILGNMDDNQILSHLRHGRYILHPVKRDSILTKHRIEDIARMIKMNSPNLINMTLLKKEIIKQ